METEKRMVVGEGRVESYSLTCTVLSVTRICLMLPSCTLKNG